MTRRDRCVVILLSTVRLTTRMLLPSLAPAGTPVLRTLDGDPISEVPRGWKVLTGT
jgi:hypothetical protein